MQSSSNTPTAYQTKTSRKSAINWVNQTIRLFPQIGEGATEEYIAAFIDLVCQYSEDIIAIALHPSTGLPIKCEFLPALGKIKEALDEAAFGKYGAIQREHATRAQIEAREADAKLAEDRKNRPTYEQLMEKVPSSLKLQHGATLPKMTTEEFLAKWPHVTKEMLDACPNAPKPRTEQHLGHLGDPASRPSYTGPIEDIRPGDVIEWDRMQEYRDFMRKKHGIKEAKNWGFSENWIDSGQRPFRVAEKPEEANPFVESNSPPNPAPRKSPPD